MILPHPWHCVSSVHQLHPPHWSQVYQLTYSKSANRGIGHQCKQWQVKDLENQSESYGAEVLHWCKFKDLKCNSLLNNVDISQQRTTTQNIPSQWYSYLHYMSLLLLEDKEQIQEYGIPLILFTIHLADPPMLLEIDWIYGKYFNVRTQNQIIEPWLPY